MLFSSLTMTSVPPGIVRATCRPSSGNKAMVGVLIRNLTLLPISSASKSIRIRTRKILVRVEGVMQEILAAQRGRFLPRRRCLQTHIEGHSAFAPDFFGNQTLGSPGTQSKISGWLGERQQLCSLMCCCSTRWAALDFARQSFASAFKVAKSTDERARVLAFIRFTMR